MSQLALFDQNVPLYKELHKTVLLNKHSKDVTYKYDFTKSYGIPHADVLAMLMFLYKCKYDDPVRNVVFSYRSFCNFIGQNPKEVKVRYDKFRTINDPDNYAEYIIDRLHSKSLMLNANFTFSKDKESYEVENSKSFKLIDEFTKISNSNKRDKELNMRDAYYEVDVNIDLLLKLGNRSFYINSVDYAQIRKKTISRNPSIPVLYMEMCFAINALSFNPESYIQPSFNMLCELLGYDREREPRTLKQQIERRITSLLKHKSLAGLSFTWKPTKNNLYYVPHFHIKNEQAIVLKEGNIEKLKRLDNFFINRLLKEDTIKLPFETLQGAIETFSGALVKSIFIGAMSSCFKSEMSHNEIEERYNLLKYHLCYKDNRGTVYVSALAKGIICDNKPLIEHDRYTKIENNIELLFKK